MVRLPEKGDEEHDGSSLPSLTDLSHEVEKLVRLISTTDISDLHIESGPVRISIKRGAYSQQPAPYIPSNNQVYTPPVTLPTPAAGSSVNLIGHSPVHGDEIVLLEGEQLIVAPMVGTYYSAPAPNEPPYVSEDDLIEPGQVVGIIEAMKMMNEIECEVGGRVVRILVQNAQPVEYGQPLMVVRVG